MCLSTREKNQCLILVRTFLLNGVVPEYVVLLSAFLFVSCGWFIE